MQKTVTLSTLHVNGGRRSSVNNTFDGYSSIGSSAGNVYIGRRDNGDYNASYFLFDTSDLDKYRSKKIISLTLRVYVQNGYISTSTTFYHVGFKYNDVHSTATNTSSNAWARTNNTQTAIGSYDIAYLRADSTGAEVNINVGTTLPKYGYVIGMTSSTAPAGNFVQCRGEYGGKLIIVYEEVGAYVKYNNAWREADGYVKVSGVWKPITATYVKINGEWKST